MESIYRAKERFFQAGLSAGFLPLQVDFMWEWIAEDLEKKAREDD